VVKQLVGELALTNVKALGMSAGAKVSHGSGTTGDDDNVS
jgi:hypothetical protein